MADWAGMFRLETPILELVIRGVVVYLLLLLLIRVVGQREAGGLGITDVLIIVLLAQAVGGGLTGDSESITDAVLVTTILLCSVVVDAAAYRLSWFSVLTKARPRVLIREGELNHRVLRREFMTIEEVRSQLRLHGIEDIREVRCAYLEPNGMISVPPARGDTQDTPPAPPRG